MSYIPANPHFAIVNCKIGDLNLTPIPPDTLESFTYERDTNMGAGNKFTIVVHDETAILMESYLAETAFKAMNSQGFDFGEDDNIYDGDKLKDEYVDINKKPTPERVKLDENGNEIQGDDKDGKEDEAQAQSINYSVNLMSLSDFDDIPTFYQSTYDTSSSRSNNEELTMRQDESNHAALLHRNIRENETAFSSIDSDTNIISGGTGRSITTNTSPIYDISTSVIPNIIDNDKLDYADPSTGIDSIYGYRVSEGTWVGEEALKEFDNGFDSGDEDTSGDK